MELALGSPAQDVKQLILLTKMHTLALYTTRILAIGQIYGWKSEKTWKKTLSDRHEILAGTISDRGNKTGLVSAWSDDLELRSRNLPLRKKRKKVLNLAFSTQAQIQAPVVDKVLAKFERNPFSHTGENRLAIWIFLPKISKSKIWVFSERFFSIYNKPLEKLVTSLDRASFPLSLVLIWGRSDRP